MSRSTQRRLRRWIPAAMIAVLPLLAAGCGGDTAGPETGADVGDVEEGTGQLVGQQVTFSD